MVGKDQDFLCHFSSSMFMPSKSFNFCKKNQFFKLCMIDDIHHISPYMNFHGFHNVLMLTSWIGWIRSGKVWKSWCQCWNPLCVK